MRNRSVVRLGAAGAAFAVVGLAAGPALAADNVAQASAAAATITVASNRVYSGEYSVTNDGTKQTASGNNTPAVSVLSGQQLLQIGTLAQDATTSVANGRGSSAACSGIAGDGATVAAVGSGDCLTPGQNIALNAGNLDLSSLSLANGSLTSQLPASLTGPLNTISAAILPQLEGQIQTALTTALNGVGNPALTLNIGAVQSQCTADTASAAGDATLTDLTAAIQLPSQLGGQRVSLLDFPVHPAPNTKVLTDLSGVAEAIQNALRTQINALTANTTGIAALDAALAIPGNTIQAQLDSAFTQLRTQALSQIQTQLAPLEQNILDGTLNEQSGTANSIDVTAVDLKILPAAQAFGFDSAARLQLAHSSCGPNGERAVSAPAAPAAPQAAPAVVPTEVRSGLATGDDQGLGLVGMGALGALMVVGVGTGMAVQRRRLEALKVPVRRSDTDGS